MVVQAVWPRDPNLFAAKRPRYLMSKK